MHDVPGRPVISNCGFYTENISSFLDFHLRPLAQEVKSYIKDNNDFLEKLYSLQKLTWWYYFCTVGVVSIPHDEGLSALQKRLNWGQKEDVTTSTLIGFAEVVLKNNMFAFKEKRWSKSEVQLLVQNFLHHIIYCWNSAVPIPVVEYIDDIFFLWEHGEDKLPNWMRNIQI